MAVVVTVIAAASVAIVLFVIILGIIEDTINAVISWRKKK